MEVYHQLQPSLKQDYHQLKLNTPERLAKSRLASQGKLYQVIMEESKESYGSCPNKNLAKNLAKNADKNLAKNALIDLDPDTILSIGE